MNYQDYEPLGFDDALLQVMRFVTDRGGSGKHWYAGIAGKPNNRIHQQHKVPDGYVDLIVVRCMSRYDAEGIEQFLIEKGCDGHGGEGDDRSVFVYAYIKTPSTLQ